MSERINNLILSLLENYSEKLIFETIDNLFTLVNNAKTSISIVQPPILAIASSLPPIVQPIVQPIALPVKLGQIGETHILDWFKENDYFATSVSTINHTGDILLKFGKFTILVEVKNYNLTVPSSETAKLIKDIEISKPDAAIFISLRTNIAKRQDFEWEIYNDVPIIYINLKENINILHAVVGILKQFLINNNSRIENLLDKFAENGKIVESVISNIGKDRELLFKTIGETSQSLYKHVNNIARSESKLIDLVEQYNVNELNDNDVPNSLQLYAKKLRNVLVLVVPITKIANLNQLMQNCTSSCKNGNITIKWMEAKQFLEYI